MLDGRYLENVTVGSIVRIEPVSSKSLGLETGTVAKILEEVTFHEDGILVMLTSKIKGRVQVILQKSEKVDKTLEDKIIEGENSQREFKSSFAFDWNKFTHSGIKSVLEENQFIISKSISAFANSKGGTLYIGIKDNGEPLGLVPDYEVLNANADKFEILLKNSIKKYFDDDKEIFNCLARLHIIKYKTKDICEIIVNPSPKPVVIFKELRTDKGTIKLPCFFVRIGNSSEDLPVLSFINYWLEKVQTINEQSS